MARRRVFYSFHYEPDSWRTSQVREIGTIEGNKPVTDNDWETVKGGGDVAIKRWIVGEMYNRSCTVVLVGTKTAERRWIKHEIIESWNQGMGVVGIRIHGLKDKSGRTAAMGRNPFDYITYEGGMAATPSLLRSPALSSVVKCYDPTGQSSREKYDWISRYLANVVEQAIGIRGQSSSSRGSGSDVYGPN